MHFKSSLLLVVSLALSAVAYPTENTDINYELIDPEIEQIVFASLDLDAYDGLDSSQNPMFADWKTDVVKGHNAYRAHYSAPALTWSDALYPGTQQWANQCKFQHSKGSYGENLAAGTGNAYAFRDGLKGWMDEASKYDWNHPGFSSGTGHFTQVVWKSSKQVACAIANCGGGTIFPQASKYVVCRYSPPGNYEGQYPANVGRYHN
ncbi:hypothetical protein M422DRAFT_65847 [Sphaerobolus stellatus SS14]|nr:hypothetical protein M422DRAFT_65847 [Sphaerobolus stellatus SS14]